MGGALRGYAPGKPQTMNLADYRIAGDAVGKPPGNLAGAEAFAPQALQKFDPLIRPCQLFRQWGLFLICGQFSESLLSRRTNLPVR
jgi:hypothetical protein